MKSVSDAPAELPQNSPFESTAEPREWVTPCSTMLDDFEALLEAAERITKSSAHSQPPESQSRPNGDPAQLLTALHAT